MNRDQTHAGTGTSRIPLIESLVSSDAVSERATNTTHEISGSVPPIKSARFLLIALTSIALIVASTAIYPYIPEYYEASALVLVRPTDQDGQPLPDQASDNALSSGAIETYTDLLSSRPLLLSVAKVSDVQAPASAFSSLKGTLAGRWLERFLHNNRPDPPSPNALVRSLRANLGIHQFQKSYALRVGFTARSPDVAARMTNVLLSQFIADQVSRRATRQQDYETALKQRVERLKARAAKAEAAVTRYAVSSGLINVGIRDAAKQQLLTLSEAFAKAKSDALSATEHAQKLASLDKEHELDSSPEVMEFASHTGDQAAGSPAEQHDDVVASCPFGHE